MLLNVIAGRRNTDRQAVADFIIVINGVNGLEFEVSGLDAESEETALEFCELLLVSLGSLTFCLSAFCLSDAVDLLHIAVVSLFEIGGADVFWGLYVLTTTLQHLDVVHPNLRVLDLVAVAGGYLDGAPIGVDVRLVSWSCT